MRLLFLMMMVSFIPSAYAEDCAEKTDISWILSAIEGQNINLNLARESLKTFGGLKHDAGKMINPEIEHFTTIGPTPGQSFATSESRFWMTWITANKRQKRRLVWEREEDIQKIGVEQLKREILKTALISLANIKHVQEELDWNKEMVNSIEEIIRRYQHLSVLGPEQEIERDMFKSMLVDLKLSESTLELSLHMDLHLIKEMTGYQCQMKAINYTKAKSIFPDTKTLKGSPRDESFLVMTQRLMMDKARAIVDKEEAMKTPDFKWGPLMQYYSNNNHYANMDTKYYGLMIVLPIAVLDRNQGLRESSLLQYKVDQGRLELAKLREEHHIVHRLEEYEHLSILSAEQSKITDIRQKNKKFLNSLQRGLISIPHFVQYVGQISTNLKLSHQMERDRYSILLEVSDLKQQFNAYELSKVMFP